MERWRTTSNSDSRIPSGSATEGKALTPLAAQIENPDPQAGTNNWYDDGYASGSYVGCADLSQPGVPAVVNYLESLPRRPVNPNCDPGHFYILNQLQPRFNGDGSSALPLSPLTLPGSSVCHIGDALLEKNISPGSITGTVGISLSDPAFANPLDTYCNICNPFSYATDIMTNATLRTEHIQDSQNLYEDIKSGRTAGGLDREARLALTAIRRLRSLKFSKASPRTSSTQCRRTRNSGPAPPSSSPSTKAAATMTPVTCNPSTSSATARVFLS